VSLNYLNVLSISSSLWRLYPLSFYDVVAHTVCVSLNVTGGVSLKRVLVVREITRHYIFFPLECV
jgi:hypothetical protein